MAHLFGGTASASWAGLIGALIQVALIDITLASDNAVAVGMAAAGLPRPQRHYAIVLGLGLAVVLLCVMAFFAVRLLEAGGGGLVLGGGLLLLLVSWQMWRDLRASRRVREAEEAAARRPKTLMRALGLIFVADISTSLDNVLAIAGVARGQPPWVLFVGLALSVALTGFAAAGVARLMHRWPWLGYIGLVVVIFVAGGMLYDGAHQMGWAP
jgi:YjbE family integral membrane protein